MLLKCFELFDFNVLKYKKEPLQNVIARIPK